MKRIGKRIVCVSLMFVLTFSYSLTCFATTVEEVQQQISDLEKEKKKIEQNIADLEKQTGDIEAYIGELDAQLSELNDKITTLSGQITDTQEELEQNQKELGEAEESLASQYDVMKARIKYMYENGSDDYLSLLLDASSMTDLLNRAEYINKISKYDQNLYGDYEGTVSLISEKQTEIQNSLDTLSALQENLELQKEGVNTLLENKNSQLKTYNSQIEAAQEEATDKQSEIDEQNDYVEQLLEEARKKAEEEEARKKAEEEAKKKAEEEAKKKAEEEAAKKDEESNTSSGSSSSNNSSSENSSSGGSSSSTTSSSLRWPLNVSGRISSSFGYRTSPTAGASTYHKGIDIAASSGTSIVAAAGGTVVTSTYHYSAGNYIMISHGNGLYTVYMHCSKLLVSVGDTVSKGQEIALVGSTGVSTGAHLHFGVSKNGTYVNPLDYVSQP